MVEREPVTRQPVYLGAFTCRKDITDALGMRLPGTVHILIARHDAEHDLAWVLYEQGGELYDVCAWLHRDTVQWLPRPLWLSDLQRSADLQTMALADGSTAPWLEAERDAIRDVIAWWEARA